MKVMLEKKDLAEIVGSVARGAGVTPQTDGMLIEAANGRLRMTAHSFNLGIRLTTGEVEVKDEGSTVVKANHFADLVKRLPDSVITLEINDNKLTIKYGRSKANLNTIGIDQFAGWPVKETTELLKLPGKEIKKGFGSTAFACAANHFRAIFTGVYVDAKVSEKELVFVGSDTHRLAIRRLPFEGFIEKNNFGFSIPVRNCTEISRVVKDDEVTVSSVGAGNIILFTGDNYEVFTSTIEGQYPNYMAVIPKAFVGEVKVNGSFKSSMDRILTLPTDDKVKIPQVNVEAGEGLTLSAFSEAAGEIKETLPLSYKGEALKTAFNAQYVVDALRMLPEDATIKFGGETAPSVFKPDFKDDKEDDYTIVLVPIRL